MTVERLRDKFHEKRQAQETEKVFLNAALNKFLLTRGMRIANGYGKIKDLTYRIATMGETTMEDVDKLLEGMTDFMKQ